jgi:predicted nucleotidyltransferase
MATELRQSIINTFKPFHPERIVLFGSHARGDADEFSDIDVIIVYRTNKRFMERLEELYLAWNVAKAIDILAYTPDEFIQMQRDGNALIEDAVKEGEVLYEKQ